MAEYRIRDRGESTRWGPEAEDKVAGRRRLLFGAIAAALVPIAAARGDAISDATTHAANKLVTNQAANGSWGSVETNYTGPIVAGLILGYVGDPTRFPTKERFAAYNGIAPIEASSGPRKRHRLNPRGNRKLNHAMHLIAVTQISHDTPGRVYYDRKTAEGKTNKEALRALKRRISDAVWRQLQVDLAHR